MGIIITKEMVNQALAEADKREPHIQHHFDVEHLSNVQRNVLGFLGEFACRKYLNIPWKSGIRTNYNYIDNGDIVVNGIIFDVKTETIPNNKPYKSFDKVFNRRIDDDEPYGRRLINGEQKVLLHKYDYIIFGAFIRGEYNKWYALGFVDVKTALKYEAIKKSPCGIIYPEAALPIRTSELKPMNEIYNIKM